jgi:hypothetical protein
MRFLIVLIIIALLVFKYWPEPEPAPLEETFIGRQLEPLKKAENVEQQYQEALEKANLEIEKASDGN